MSIKSRTPGIASDVPLKSKQRAPNYLQHNAKPAKGQVDNISKYVDKNLSKVDKPRHGESR